MDQAAAWLTEDIQSAADSVNRLVKIPISQNVFNSCCDFVYNVGSGAFAGSTLLKLINENRLEEAAQEFTKWDHANGQEVAGLLRRRLAEQSEFLEP
jgi:lysozyme